MSQVEKPASVTRHVRPPRRKGTRQSSLAIGGALIVSFMSLSLPTVHDDPRLSDALHDLGLVAKVGKRPIAEHRNIVGGRHETDFVRDEDHGFTGFLKIRESLYQPLLADGIEVEFGSSRMTTDGSPKTALARPIRCLWPPESMLPYSPISVLYPWGNFWIRSCTPASSAAAITSSWLASVKRAMFCSIVPGKSSTFWGR